MKLRLPAYVKLVLASEYPRTQITTRITPGTALYHGPFRTRAGAEEFEHGFLDVFQIRRCQKDLIPAADHPGCIYGEMNMGTQIVLRWPEERRHRSAGLCRLVFLLGGCSNPRSASRWLPMQTVRCRWITGFETRPQPQYRLRFLHANVKNTRRSSPAGFSRPGDGVWISFENLDMIPWRKVFCAISRTAAAVHSTNL